MFDCSILCEVDLSQQLCLSLTYLRVSPSVVSDMASMKQTPRMSADEVRLVRTTAYAGAREGIWDTLKWSSPICLHDFLQMWPAPGCRLGDVCEVERSLWGGS